MDVDLLDLKVDYFEPVSREVFDEYMRNRGFAPGEADDTGSLIYRRDDCFLRVHYYVEDRPRYSPMVSIGVLPATSLGIPFERIGLWYAVPTGSDAKDYELWRFSDAVELKQVLTRIRDEVVEVYGRPLWENPDQLARLINRRYEEAVAEREDEALKRKKAEAEQAFRSHDYRRAATLYSQMQESDLSSAERKRYELSRKYSP
jgi:hypothetical protein